MSLRALSQNTLFPYLLHTRLTKANWFFAGKMTLTGMGVWLLVRASDHPQHRGPSALTLLRLCFFGYATLMAWHLILVGRLT